MSGILKNNGHTFIIALGMGVNNRVTIIRNWRRIIGLIRICVCKGTHATIHAFHAHTFPHITAYAFTVHAINMTRVIFKNIGNSLQNSFSLLSYFNGIFRQYFHAMWDTVHQTHTDALNCTSYIILNVLELLSDYKEL